MLILLLLTDSLISHPHRVSQRRVTISDPVIDLTQDADMNASPERPHSTTNEVIDISTDEDSPTSGVGGLLHRTVSSVTSGLENIHVGTSTQCPNLDTNEALSSEAKEGKGPLSVKSEVVNSSLSLGNSGAFALVSGRGRPVELRVIRRFIDNLRKFGCTYFHGCTGRTGRSSPEWSG